MEEDGAIKFDFFNGCSESTNMIIARYRMVINLIENEQAEHDEADMCACSELLHLEEVIEEPMFEINLIEHPNKNRR
jgi:hypothetical protein